MAGDFTFQKYLASMEGALLSGKLAAEAVAQVAAHTCSFLLAVLHLQVLAHQEDLPLLQSDAGCRFY